MSASLWICCEAQPGGQRFDSLQDRNKSTTNQSPVEGGLIKCSCFLNFNDFVGPLI